MSAAPAEPSDALTLAILFHNLYEHLAPEFGYETRAETRKFDPHSPNGKLMIAVCAALASSAGTPHGAREPYVYCDKCGTSIYVKELDGP